MTITAPLSGSAAGNVTGAALSVPAYSGIAAGDVEFLEVRGRPDVTVSGTPTITVPGDWSLLAEHLHDHPGFNQDLYLGVWWRPSTGSTATISVSCSSHFAGFNRGYYAIRTCVPGIPAPPGSFDIASGGAIGTTYTAPGVVAPNREHITLTWVTAAATGSGTGSVSAANGFTSEARAGGPSQNTQGAIAYKIGSTPGAVTMPVWGLAGTLTRAGVSTVFAYMPPPNSGWSVGFLKF